MNIFKGQNLLDFSASSLQGVFVNHISREAKVITDKKERLQTNR